jgi:hypothetical protein
MQLLLMLLSCCAHFAYCRYLSSLVCILALQTSFMSNIIRPFVFASCFLSFSYYRRSCCSVRYSLSICVPLMGIYEHCSASMCVCNRRQAELRSMAATSRPSSAAHLSRPGAHKHTHTHTTSYCHTRTHILKFVAHKLEGRHSW